jgi:putative ABC transport system substrate-binding protein
LPGLTPQVGSTRLAALDNAKLGQARVSVQSITFAKILSKRMDARVKPAHDELRVFAFTIGRRAFITLLGGAAAACVSWPLAARAQQPAMPVIGVLYGVSAAEWARPMAGFHRGLGEMGFVEGRNVAIEYRWAEGRFDRMPAMAGDLIGRKVAVILVGGNLPGVRNVMAATQTIPIVFTTNADPVAAGVVTSLGRPGGNVTGVTGLGGELGPKRLELLHEMLPTATKFAMLVNPSNPVTTQDAIQGAQAGARRLGLEIVVVNAGTEHEIETAFATAVQQRVAGLLGTADAYFESRRDQIAALGLRHALPTISSSRASVAAGTLMSYGASNADFYRQAGVYVGRILKGEKPANLPVVQPTKFELVINLKTAKALGLDVPLHLQQRADEVIE